MRSGLLAHVNAGVMTYDDNLSGRLRIARAQTRRGVTVAIVPRRSPINVMGVGSSIGFKDRGQEKRFRLFART
jgi:hypothetical protein